MHLQDAPLHTFTVQNASCFKCVAGISQNEQIFKDKLCLDHVWMSVIRVVAVLETTWKLSRQKLSLFKVTVGTAFLFYNQLSDAVILLLLVMTTKFGLINTDDFGPVWSHLFALSLFPVNLTLCSPSFVPSSLSILKERWYVFELKAVGFSLHPCRFHLWLNKFCFSLSSNQTDFHFHDCRSLYSYSLYYSDIHYYGQLTALQKLARTSTHWTHLSNIF